ncbi:3-hydroxybutyrate dehydrogenase [Tistlia consotensis]|uniref:3-hydroxybutyrate dehydrogenase n=1 Tax=Tistlia consotensis USBA 355 TaxID=560819 RepID=A0A1Y6C770_9PROT|nr:3-hydroxybutyrate dehydrogenase [Tistlia consotensis]SMF38188.1 3-hydroxybutyrate dehydrogenase [Tistlia consotensis USBA 355]SNR37345.1 3-hydroxybutyrate dehydrogenase [Tistlia consotensis]
MTDLSGKTALVTGSTSGIGEAIAWAFAAQGANVVLNGFGDAAAIARLKTAMAEKHGVTVVYDGADMSKPGEIEAMMKKAEAEFGAVDILVNNAGIQHTADIEDFPPERWDAIIAINLSSAFHTTHHALPAMKRRGWGRIVNIASAHGLVASAQKVAYVAAKHGIVGMTKVTALETARDGITCNAICPGWVLTPLVQKQIDALAEREGLSGDEARVKLIGEKMPTAEAVTPEQIGGFAVFLCSPAADRITGSALSIDGGWTAQ